MSKDTISKVIDVSYHQGIIDWEKVKASGQVDAAIIRCGYRGYATGALMEDTQFRNNINGALNNGIPVGVYFFSTALSAAEAREEANYTIDLIQDFNVSFPVVFDFEGYNDSRYRTYQKTSQALRTAMCRAFCDTVTQRGYGTLVYGSKGVIRSKYDLSQLAAFYIWCARYAGGYNSITDDLKYFPDLGEHTSRIAMWQYSSIGRIPGIRGNVDLNNLYKDYDIAPPAPDNEQGESNTEGYLDSIDKREIYCEVGEYHNGSTPETVYEDTDCTKKIGSLDPHEKCEALGIFDGRVAIMYTQNGTRSEKVGFVKWQSGYKPGNNRYVDKSYQNGSTPETVYADNAGKVKIGSLSPRERCDCMGIVDGMAIVRYNVTGKARREKIGFVKWLGGIV